MRLYAERPRRFVSSTVGSDKAGALGIGCGYNIKVMECLFVCRKNNRALRIYKNARRIYKHIPLKPYIWLLWRRLLLPLKLYIYILYIFISLWIIHSFRLLNIQFISKSYEWIYSKALNIIRIIAITGWWLQYRLHFTSHQIVFDLTFCGDWADSVWNYFPVVCWRVWPLNAKCNIVPLWPLLATHMLQTTHCLCWGLLAYQLPKGLLNFIGVSIPDCQIVDVTIWEKAFWQTGNSKKRWPYNF